MNYYYRRGTGDPKWLKDYPRDTAIIDLRKPDGTRWHWSIGAISRYSKMTEKEVDAMLLKHVQTHFPSTTVMGWVCRQPKEAKMKSKKSKRTGNKAARVAAIDAAYKAGDADKLRKLMAKWPDEKQMIAMRLAQLVRQQAAVAAVAAATAEAARAVKAGGKPTPRCPRPTCGRAMRLTGYTRTVGVLRRKQYACEIHDEFAYGPATRRKGKKPCRK